MAIPVNVVLQPYRIGEKQGHSIRPVLNATLTYDDTLKKVVDLSGVNAAKSRAVMDAITLVLMKEGIENRNVVRLGFGEVRISVTGGLSDLSEPINDKCKARLILQPSAEIMHEYK